MGTKKRPSVKATPKRKPAAKALAPRTQKAEPRNAGPNLLYVPRSIAGVRVTEDTALTYGAVWACVRFISESLATLPLRLHRSRPSGGSDVQPDNPADWLVHTQANPETPAFHFRETLIAHTLTWGNGYAEIERDLAGRPVWLWQLSPDRVNPERDARGRLFYDIANPREANTALLPEDILHFRGLGYDGLVGYSVIQMAARAIGAAMAADAAAATLFANDTTPGGVLQHPGRLSEPARKNLRDTWTARHGGPSNRRTVAILEEGMKWEPTQMPANDAQVLESRQWGPTEIARIFRVPPHKIGDLTRSTFSNIESQEIEAVVDCLLPWAVRCEQEYNVKLIGRNNRGVFFFKHNFKGRLRGDTAAQTSHLQQLLDRGVYDIDEAREYLELNPIGPDGRKRFVQVNMQLLEKAGEEPPPGSRPPAGQAPVMPDDEPEEDTDDDDAEEADGERQMSALRIVVEDACGRISRRETHRIADAKKRGAPESWIEEFVVAHGDYIAEALGPAVEAVALALGKPAAAKIALAVVAELERDSLRAALPHVLANGDSWTRDVRKFAADVLDLVRAAARKGAG